MAWFKKEKKENVQMLGYEITFEPLSSTEDEAEQRMIQSAYNKVKQMSKGIIEKLQMLIKSYPHLPALKNYLMIVYERKGLSEKAYQLAVDTFHQHPDYLFGKINLGNVLLHKKEYDKIEEYLGVFHEITDLAPERKLFHINEVEAFNTFYIKYLVEKEHIEAAESRLELLRKISPKYKQLGFLSRIVQYARMSYNFKLMQAKTEKAPKIVVKAKKIFEPSTEPPIFHHPEIQELYKRDMYQMDSTTIQTILALPRESLIQDLETVLADAIKRNEYFQENADDYLWQNLCFPLHAILFLGELEAEQSIEQVLNILRQDKQFYEFWIGDWSESLDNAIYKLGKNKVANIKNYFFEENHYTYFASILLNVLERIYFLQPHRQQEIIEMYRELFTYYLANEGNENLIDGTLLGFGVGDILSFQAVELMDLVEEMYAKEMVDENICGDIETVKKEIVAKRRRYRRIEWDIFETYADIRGERKKKPEEELTQEERKEIMRGFDSDIQELIEDYWEEGEDFEEIYEEDELPPIFAKSPEPRLPLVQGFSKFSRNDKVSVRYKDGTVKKDVKFKKVEEDLKNGKCEII